MSAPNSTTQIAEALSFRSGISLGISVGKVIAQRGKYPMRESPTSLIMEWSALSGWHSYNIALTAIQMHLLKGSQEQLVVMGEGGYVFVCSNGQIVEEMVDESREGPLCRGNICDMRLIGSHLYAVGMSRQVYRRESANLWVHCDRGTVQLLGDLEVSGFRSIDGLTESDVYATGYNGEIWHYDGRLWCQVQSPTNVVMHKIRAVEPDLVFASGQEGVLLRGSRAGWQVIDQTATTENLWGLEWFDGSLYVAGDRAVYRLDGNQFEPVDTGLDKGFTFQHLHANAGALWSFGPKHIAKTDGRAWVDVTPKM